MREAAKEMDRVPVYLRPGDWIEIGKHTFTPEEIIAFAREFDPQPFHLDTEAAKHTLFGGLCASGWHTASQWMALQRIHIQKQEDELIQAGEKRIPRFGASPGFSDLKWLRPVFAGDTITYANRNLSIRPTRSRPGWWISQVETRGTKDNGELAITFKSAVFIEL